MDGSLSRRSVILILAVAFAVSNASATFIPLAVGALAEHGWSPSLMGMFSTVEIGMAGVAALYVAAKIEKLDPIKLCCVGLILCVVGGLLSPIMGESFGALLFPRAIAGAGTGLLQAASLALVARLSNPEKIYGFLFLAVCLMGLSGFTAIPPLMAYMQGHTLVFIFEAGLAVVGFFVIYIPRKRLAAYVLADTASRADVASDGHFKHTRVRLPLMFASLASIFFIATADSSIWPFLGPLGMQSGLAVEDLGPAMSLGIIAACVGTLISVPIAKRLGLFVTTFMAIMLSLTGTWVIIHGSNAMLFQVFVGVRLFCSQFLYPLLNATYAEIDPHGRVVAACTGLMQVAITMGPFITGFLVTDDNNFDLVAYFAIVFELVGMLAIALLLLLWKRKSVAQVQMAPAQ